MKREKGVCAMMFRCLCKANNAKSAMTVSNKEGLGGISSSTNQTNPEYLSFLYTIQVGVKIWVGQTSLQLPQVHDWLRCRTRSCAHR